MKNAMTFRAISVTVTYGVNRVKRRSSMTTKQIPCVVEDSAKMVIKSLHSINRRVSLAARDAGDPWV